MTSHRHPGPRALLAVAILMLAAVPAHADHTVGVVVTGESTMQPQLVAQLETWLRSHGHDLVSAPVPPDAMDKLIDCFVIEDQACARKIIETRAKTDAVLFAQVNVTAGATAAERTVTLTAYWLEKGKAARSERRFCPRCTNATMRTAADELMEALAGSLSRGRLKLTSSPPGAKVTVDSAAVGKTPIEHSLPPGDHQVLFELDGRRPETRSVNIKYGQTTAVDVEFFDPWVGRRKVIGYAALAGGVLLGAAGGVMFAIDEDADPGNTTEPTYRDTAPAGIALAAGGAAAIGVGLYFVLSKPKRSSAPAVGLAPGGGVIGWTGRF